MKMKYLKDEFGRTDKRYMISKDGSYIRDKKTGKKLIPYINKGYKVISITINNINYHSIKISILQWQAWNGIIPDKYHIHHMGKDKHGNFDKTNDHIDKLNCVTREEHYRIHRTGSNNPFFGIKGKRHYLYGKTGEKANRSILSNDKVSIIFYFSYIKKLSQRKIANKMNVSRGCISGVLNGKTWNPNHLTKRQLMKQFINPLLR